MTCIRHHHHHHHHPYLLSERASKHWQTTVVFVSPREPSHESRRAAMCCMSVHKTPPPQCTPDPFRRSFGISPSIGYTARCSGFEAACLVLDKSKHSQRAIVWLPKNSRESRWAAIFAVLKCTQSAPQSPSAKSVGIFTFRADPDQVAAFQPACVVRVCKTPANSYRMATPEIVDFGVGLGPS